MLKRSPHNRGDMNVIVPKKCRDRWERLQRVDGNNPVKGGRSGLSKDEDDPFDCSKLACPPTHHLVDRILDSTIDEWKELDERKIESSAAKKKVSFATSTKRANEVEDGSESDANKRSKPIDGRAGGGWLEHEEKLLLPDQFDYLNSQPEPPADAIGPDDERVIALADPSRILSYNHELWKIFDQVPTVETVEQNAIAGISFPNTRQLVQEITEDSEKNLRLDGHCLSRLRSSERHGITASRPDAPKDTTIMIEFLRRQPKRGAAADPNRAIAEFRGSQTLADVHSCLVDMVNDDLWLEKPSHDGAAKTTSEGFFFIENVFYISEAVNYAKPIIDWIDGSSSTPIRARREYLGISSNDKLEVKPMASMRLCDMGFRLGVRYHHCHHGDVETSMFISDVRYAGLVETQYPLIHDIFSQAHSLPHCEACLNRPASLVTSLSCRITHGGRFLCQRCCVALKLDPADKKAVQRVNIWREQSELSSGAGKEKYF